MFAQIIVDVAAKQVNKPYTYLVPTSMEGLIEKGTRVIVPFGMRKVLGFVVEVMESFDSEYSLKEIISLLDLTPVLNKEMLEIGYEMVEENTGFLINAFKTIIPSALLMKYTKRLKRIKNNLLDSYFSKEEISFDDIPFNMQKVLKDEILKGNIEVIYQVIKKESILEDTFIHLEKYALDLPTRQQEIVDYLLNNKDVLKGLLPKEFSSSTIKTLEKKGIISLLKQEKYREIGSAVKEYYKKVVLNDEQMKCYLEIKKSLNCKKTFLLHGVTGSGKTEIYLDIIEDVLKSNKNAIFLVPEISLTPQMVSRVKGRFKNDVAVFHSGLTQNEKYDEWRRIFRNEVRVVVGARSAIFVPINNLGIIIIDEEHESSYKQDQGFKYNAKDIALFRSNYHNCPLILGSATPDIASYKKALDNEYQLLEITQRANHFSLPEMHLINMSDELKNGNKSMFSVKLQNLLEDRLNKHEQTILLINKRGYSSFVMCRECGETIKCKNCDVTLTYHKNTDKLVCHYCGYKCDKPVFCPSCGGKKIKEVGVGTEQVCENLLERYPMARVLRMDADTTTTKGSHALILNKFMNHEADILVGTQMISKGLDFPNVTLVGMLMADMILKLPDYRNSERTYQLIMQVSGRAGRHDKLGEVVVQSYNSDHYSIELAKNGNYKDFFDAEMKMRQMAGYPPYVKLSQIVIEHIDYKEAFKRAKEIADKIKNKKNVLVLGPAIASISKVKNKFRVQIMIKSKEKINLLPILEENQDIDIFIDNEPILI